MTPKIIENNTAFANERKMHPGNTRVNGNEIKNAPLNKFFADAFKDNYYASYKLVEALQNMYDAATTEELKNAFEDHQLQTKKHINRLEKIFKLINEIPEQKK